MSHKCYTPDEVADLLGVSTWAVIKRLKTGELKGLKLGNSQQAKWRIPASSLDEFYARNLYNPAA